MENRLIEEIVQERGEKRKGTERRLILANRFLVTLTCEDLG